MQILAVFFSLDPEYCILNFIYIHNNRMGIVSTRTIRAVIKDEMSSVNRPWAVLSFRSRIFVRRLGRGGVLTANHPRGRCPGTPGTRGGSMSGYTFADSHLERIARTPLAAQLGSPSRSPLGSSLGRPWGHPRGNALGGRPWAGHRGRPWARFWSRPRSRP